MQDNMHSIQQKASYPKDWHSDNIEYKHAQIQHISEVHLTVIGSNNVRLQKSLSVYELVIKFTDTSCPDGSGKSKFKVRLTKLMCTFSILLVMF